MFKQNKKIVYLFLGLAALVIALQYFLPKPLDLNRNYLNKNKSPFGCYAIYNLLNNVYSKTVKVNTQTIYNLNSRTNDSTSFLIVNDKVNFNSYDAKYLYALLEKGNTVFLAASDFSGGLNDSLHLNTSSVYYDFSESFDTLIKKPGVQIRFSASNLKTKSYAYTRLANAAYFTNFDSTRFKVLACIEKNKACLIRTKVGSGTLYLMSMPDVFSNYFVANHPNREVAYACLSLLHNKELLWDEYYKTFNVSKSSPIKFILESDALYAAYLLTLLSLILYMIFEGRRRQRAIPVLSPLQNTTLEFVNVISHVYYNDKNHKNIGREKIRYFYESIRKRFQVNTLELTKELTEEISLLSGIDKKEVERLFMYCKRIETSKEVTEYELLELNRQIELFNKNSLR